jgi:hypothetical protein
VAQGARSGTRAQQQLGAKVSPSAEEQVDMAELVAVCQDTKFAYCGMATVRDDPGGRHRELRVLGRLRDVEGARPDRRRADDQPDGPVRDDEDHAILYVAKQREPVGAERASGHDRDLPCGNRECRGRGAAGRAGWRLAAARRRPRSVCGRVPLPGPGPIALGERPNLAFCFCLPAVR